MPSMADSGYRFAYHLGEDGLPMTRIQDMTHDGNGCMWFATWSGLYRFGGSYFTGFTSSGQDGAEEKSSNRFEKIEKDGFGQIWALSYNGTLYRFDPRTEKFSLVAAGRGISEIHRLSSDDFCFVSSDNSVLRTRYSDAGRSCSLHEYMAAGPHKVNGIYKDAEDNVWTATDGGILRGAERISELPGFCIESSNGALRFGSKDGKIVEVIDDKVFELNTKAPYDIKLIAAVPETLDLILGSDDGRLSLLGMDEWKLSRITVPAACFLGSGPKSFIDREGDVWIWSALGGIGRFDREAMRLEPLKYESKVPDGWNEENNLLTVQLDNQDNIWFAGSWGGVGMASRKESGFRLAAFDGSGAPSPENSVRAVAQDKDGLIYAGTKDGRIHLLDEKFRRIADWKLPYPAYSITEDAQGHIWIGVKGGGVVENTAPDVILKPEFRPRTYPKSDDSLFGMNGDLVYCLTQGPHGRLWIGSFDGQIAYTDIWNGDKGGRKFISAKNRILSPTAQMDKIRLISFGPDGRLFACGRKGIFVCENPDDEPEQMRFERFADTEKHDIQHIMFTRAGKMYASSFGSGLLLFSPDGKEKLEAVNKENGLMSDFVFSSIEDGDGNIWISSYGGLNRYNPSTGEVIGWSYEKIGKDLTFAEGRPVISKNGNILFNTTAGILYFNPKDISNSTFSPKIVLSACRFAGERIYPENETIEVRGNGRLTIRFEAVDMNGPKNITYSWKADREQEWTQLGNTPVVSLDNLKIGHHAILLRSTNADGAYTDNELKVNIIVRPKIALYLQLGFLAGLIMLSGAGYLFIRKRKSSHSLPDETSEETEQERPLSDEDRRFKEAFISFLEENLDNGDLNAEDMAAAIGVSRSTLFEKCRTLLGKAPTEYLRDLRFSKAAQMMKDSASPISEIAYMTGFNDSHYFSKAFKKHFGVSPTQYRKKLFGS